MGDLDQPQYSVYSSQNPNYKSVWIDDGVLIEMTRRGSIRDAVDALLHLGKMLTASYGTVDWSMGQDAFAKLPSTSRALGRAALKVGIAQGAIADLVDDLVAAGGDRKSLIHYYRRLEFLANKAE